MKCGKASGPTGVTSEMLKALGDIGIAHLTELVNCIFLSESVPADWRNSILVPIFKQKGDPMECGNYRAIKLMEHTMKLYERILDARLRKVISIDEMQFGFMPGKSTIDPIFILRQRQEKVLEGNRQTYAAFIDLEKAYDRVPREVLYWCLRERGVTEKMVRVVKSLYENCETMVRGPAFNTEAFPIEVGLHQVSALSQFLFAVMMDTISANTRQGLPEELLFADDLALIAETEEGLQEAIVNWQRDLEGKGLKVNTGKTEVMEWSKHRDKDMNIKDIAGRNIGQVSEFKYLGSTMEETGGCSLEIRSRIAKGCM